MAEFILNIGDKGSVQDNIVGESVVRGDLVYLEQDGKYYKATAADNTKVTTELKLVTSDSDANVEVGLLEYGPFDFTNSILIPNKKYYVSVVDGKIIDSRYSNPAYIVRYVGTAISGSLLLFNPDQTYIQADGTKVNDVTIKDPNTYTKAEVDDLIANNADYHYEHDQTTPSATWVIDYPPTKSRPTVTIFDSAETEVLGEIQYTGANQVTIYFNAPFSGRAILN